MKEQSDNTFRIRSFVKRTGRITKSQKESLKSLIDVWGIAFEDKLLDFFSVFHNNNPVILEIGFGMGQSLVEIAHAYPYLNFIGVEIHEPGVGACLSAMDSQQIENLRIIQYDAIDVLMKMIPNNSLYRVQLFFPDPWHKKRHHKRRIVQLFFLRLVHEKLSQGGTLHIATDWEPYAEDIVKKLKDCALFSEGENQHFITEKPEYRSITKFELRGLKLGHAVTDIIAFK